MPECTMIVIRHNYLRMWVWEMLQSALLKLGNHINRLRAEIDQQKQEMVSIAVLYLQEFIAFEYILVL